MKTRWKVLIGLGVVLLALLGLNTIVLNQQTKGAEVTVDGGQIVNLPGGDVQVLDLPAPADATGAPIVLVHCYLCSLEWWDELAPLLADNHRVIRIDLLGHGGSEKPSSGYSIPDQAGLVAGTLSKLDVQGAVVVGQSLGSAVAVALAEQSSQLVDRVVAMNQAPTNDSGGLPFLARLGYTPVLGQAIYRLTPDFAIRSSFGEAFAPDFEPSEEFEDDVIIPGYRAMTYTSFKEVPAELDDYRDEESLASRMTSAAVPLLVVLGSEDQVVDTPEAEEDWSAVPGVQMEVLDGVGHTPQVEAPEETARLIVEFAADAAPVVVDLKPGGGRKPAKAQKGGGKDGDGRSLRGANGGNETDKKQGGGGT